MPLMSSGCGRGVGSSVEDSRGTRCGTRGVCDLTRPDMEPRCGPAAGLIGRPVAVDVISLDFV